MGTFDGGLASGYVLRLDTWNSGVSGNSRLISWHLHIIKGSGSGKWADGPHYWSVNIAGHTAAGSVPSYDFRSYSDLTLGSGSFWVSHDANGYLTTYSSGAFDDNNTWGELGNGSCGGYDTWPRISKPPTAPGTPSSGSITASSVALSWSAPSDNRGAAVTGYEIQRATNSTFTAGTSTSSFTGTSGTVTDLASGSDYWFRVRAINSAGAGEWSSALATATLAKPPTGLASSSETPTSFTLGWSAPSGSGVTKYRIQESPAADFTGATTWEQTGTSRAVSGLAPAETYYYRVAAQTAGGWGSWSTSFSIRLGLPAPTLTSAATETTNWKLRVTWSAPSITTGLVGYRIQTARDSEFTTGVENTDVADVLTADLTRTGGRRYWVRVAARTQGGVNTWSTALSLVHTMDAGQLDGWTRTGTKPAGITYYTQQGIRRGPVGSVVSALNIESLATSSASLAANTFGIERTITDLRDGVSYLLQAKVTGRFSDAPSASQGRTYRLAVGSTLGTTAAISGATETVTLPELEFVASGTTATIKVLLADALTIAGAQDEVEQVGIHDIVLWELASDYPQRLRSTVYESNLANHFDLACNSVGATWYVDKAGTTRFNLPGAALPLSAVFSDTRDNGALEYIDIAASYDTRTMVNRLRVTNYGLDDDGELEENDELVEENTSSIDAYGAREERLTTNLYGVAPYDTSLAARLAEILDARDEPQLLVSSLRWNAQQDIAAATELEVGQRIAVHFNGAVQDSQIVAIQHDITPTRWIATLEIQEV